MKYGITINPPGTQLWSTCTGTPGAEEKFAGWGAGEIVRTASNNGLQRYMIRSKKDGLWYYAHCSGGTSCYVAVDVGFAAKTGAEADAMHQHDGVANSLAHTKDQVVRLEQLLISLRATIQTPLSQ